MSENEAASGSIRKLWSSEAAKFSEHLLRLDKASRRMRFAHSVSDSFIEDYATRMSDYGSVVYGYIEEDHVRAAAELRKLGDSWGNEAEAAFSVEAGFQNRGIGSDLMGRVIRSARNRGVQRIYLSCLPENAAMQTIARKYDAVLAFERGDVIGEIVPVGPDYFSVLAEAVDDRVSFMLSVLDLRGRLSKAA